ncbi:MAG: hypothetical protein ACI9WU_000380 [Myxococcota bacterium]
MTTRPRWAINALLVVGSLAFSLGIAEIAFRFVVPSATSTDMYAMSDDPQLSYVLRAGSEFDFEGFHILIPPSRVVISDQGLRERPVMVPRPAGERRIICLGDSFTFGWGVDVEHTWCRKLEEILGPPWRSINLGVPGYNTSQQLRLLQKVGLAFEPEVVLLMFNKTDLEPAVDHGDPDSTTAWLLDHSAILRWLHIEGFVGGGGGPEGEGEGPEGEGPEPGPSGEAAVRAGITQIGRLGRQKGFQAVMLMYPDHGGRQPIIEAALDSGMRWDSLLPATAGEGLVIPQDMHPNIEGHRRLAVHIAALVQRIIQ